MACRASPPSSGCARTWTLRVSRPRLLERRGPCRQELGPAAGGRAGQGVCGDGGGSVRTAPASARAWRGGRSRRSGGWGRGRGRACSLGAGNAELADVFDEMAVQPPIRGIKGDRIRRMAYSRAADALRRHPAAILSGSEAQAIQGVGAGMARRLDEVLETGELKELAELRQDPVVISVRELRSVYGIGPKFAAELMEKHGVHSLAQLRESVEAGSVTLSAVQRVGLRLADELRIRIPRAEAQEIEVAILHARDSLAASVDGPQDLVVVICGSYRRGKAECGDIDCLITSDTYTSNSAIPRLKQATSGDLLTRFVNALRANSLITDDLASGPSKYMGVCKLPGPGRLHRRLDIRYIPRDQFYFGMLYFTGPRSLSIDMRLRAIEKGMVLNEYCLASKDDPDDRVLVGSERQIFEALQVPYKEPHER
ncbi:unnamed protein product [Prorocentrum cordatum]|uniref:DNA polymerase n=1 Tax=Prorocentrum cordatum TaxID=2364126 RepID=A0ABN9PBD9_9DINO|nr:unnamed protein product [Polarella glacialis]